MTKKDDEEKEKEKVELSPGYIVETEMARISDIGDNRESTN